MTTYSVQDFWNPKNGTVRFNRAEISEAIALDGEGLAPDQVETIIETLRVCDFPFAVEDGETVDDAIARAYETEFLPLLQGLSRLAAEANARSAS